MLEALLGNTVKEQVLLYLYTYREGYAQEMRRKLNLPLRSVQLQVKRLEEAGLLVARRRDRTIVYQLNPRYPFYREIVFLLEKLLLALPQDVVEQFYTPRLRPRRIGKPL